MTKSIKSRFIWLGVGLVMSLSACVYDPYYYSPPGHRPYHPHYYPYYYDYYFYPGVNVYFQFSTGFYFYLSNKRWIRTKVLPPHIHLYPNNRVIIRIDSDKPYLKHHEHVKKYKPYPKYQPKPPVYKPAPRPKVRPQPYDRSKPPVAKPYPPVTKPGVPAPKPRPPVRWDERENNKKIYKEHQRRQKEYEKEYEQKREKGNKKDRNR